MWAFSENVMQIKWAGYRKLISVCDLYSQSHYSEKSDICGCEICEISAFDMGVAAAYLLVGYKACHGGDKSTKAAYVRSYYKCVQLVGEA